MNTCYWVIIKTYYYEFESYVRQDVPSLSEDELWNLYTYYNTKYNEQLDTHIETTEKGWMTRADNGETEIQFIVEEKDW